MKAAGILTALVALGTGAWFAYDSLFAAPPPAGFITKPIVRADIIKTVSATGTIEPLIKTIVGCEVSGRIRKWHKDFNDFVKQNEVLAEIDPERFQTALDRSEADLAIAEAREEELLVRYKDAERERKRIEALREQHNASENELLIAQANEAAAMAAWHGAQASVKASEANLNSARVDLERTLIRSPIDGVVITRNIEDGQTVAASFQTPELFVIANDLKQMQVNANVAESDIGLISEGGAAMFRVDAYPNRIFSGRISQIRYSATALDGVVTYVTLIETLNDDLALRPGMTANITFEVARADSALQVPNQALRFNPDPSEVNPRSRPVKDGPQKPTVYVLADNKPVPVEVEVGLTNGTVTELRGGAIKEGDHIIIERNWRAAGGARPDVTRSFRRG